MFTVCLLLAFSLTACGEQKDQVTKVVLTTGFENGEVFRIEDQSCFLPEFMIYLTNMQDQYEGVYGSQIWDVEVGEDTLEKNVKDNALARIAQVKTMNLMARDMGVALDETEKERAGTAAQTYFQSLSEEEASVLDLTQEIVEQSYQEYLLAEKVYEEIIKDINPEVSDDEARTIKVQHILFKTYAMDGTGRMIEYTDNARRNVRRTAEEVYDLAMEGEDFNELIERYSEAEESTISFGKGDMDPDFEEAAFNLGNGEISKIVETEYGYEIIKCLSTFDREETDANKVSIVEEKREQVFAEKYNSYVESLTRILNEPLWETITFLPADRVFTDSFFTVIEEVQ